MRCLLVALFCLYACQQANSQVTGGVYLSTSDGRYVISGQSGLTVSGANLVNVQLFLPVPNILGGTVRLAVGSQVLTATSCAAGASVSLSAIVNSSLQNWIAEVDGTYSAACNPALVLSVDSNGGIVLADRRLGVASALRLTVNVSLDSK